jgi:hypothetical protein
MPVPFQTVGSAESPLATRFSLLRTCARSPESYATLPGADQNVLHPRFA